MFYEYTCLAYCSCPFSRFLLCCLRQLAKVKKFLAGSRMTRSAMKLSVWHFMTAALVTGAITKIMCNTFAHYADLFIVRFLAVFFFLVFFIPDP